MPYDPSPYLDPSKCALILFECQEGVIGEQANFKGLREEVIKDDAGEIVELRCTYDPQTRGGESPPPDEEGRRRLPFTEWMSIRPCGP